MNEDPVRGFIIIPKPRRFEYGEETANNTQIKQTLNTDEVDEKNDLTSDVIAVLVFCATRDMAIRNHLEQLLKQRPSAQKFPIYISQDSDSLAVTNTVLEFVNKSENVFYMHVKRFNSCTPNFKHFSTIERGRKQPPNGQLRAISILHSIINGPCQKY